MPGQESDFADEIVQDELPVHTQPSRGNFLPWHRIRKEYIRHHQWNELTGQLVKRRWRRQLHQPETEWSIEHFENKVNEEFQVPADVLLQRALSCLVIPGEDLLDVRALWRDIQPYRCSIRYLGFNESQSSDVRDTRVHVSNNAVTSLPLVVKDSRVVQDRFEAVRHHDSQAYRYLKEYGPYHVVNLDLCGSMFPNTAKDPQDYYDALLRLIGYQFEHQKSEWLLFITTMVEPAVVHADGLKKLCGPTRENFLSYKDFADRIKKLLPTSTFPPEQSTVDLAPLTEPQIVQLFGVALGKWLIKLSQEARPQWTVAMRRSFRYSINEEKGAVMLSLAFELKPNIAPPADLTGMTKIELKTKKFPSESEIATKLAESVANICDVDSELSTNADLRARLLNASADLMKSAGYDRDAYLIWASKGEN